jgi:predicted hydrocarbon binding protein
MSQIKGFAIRGILKSIKESRWSIPDVLAAMPAEARGTFEQPIVASAWYPYSVFAQLGRAVEKVHGKGDLEVVREFGRKGAVRDLGTTFRIISAITSLEFFLNRLQILWSKYCDTGRMQLLELKGNHFVVQLLDFAGIDATHCASTEGWIEGMGAAMGATGMKARQTRCVHRGDAFCEFEGSWERLKKGFFSVDPD